MQETNDFDAIKFRHEKIKDDDVKRRRIGPNKIIRIGYGNKAIYSRWALESIEQWQVLFREARLPLFAKTGVLFLGHRATRATTA